MMLKKTDFLLLIVKVVYTSSQKYMRYTTDEGFYLAREISVCYLQEMLQLLCVDKLTVVEHIKNMTKCINPSNKTKISNFEIQTLHKQQEDLKYAPELSVYLQLPILGPSQLLFIHAKLFHHSQFCIFHLKYSL